ncbi:MAG TPA: glutamine amidotransferase [Blastocatellia bacterium]|nr:glutamine amidotransferase [Blastocatellia bacterium]
MEQVVIFLFKYRPSLFTKSQFGFGARPSVFLILALLAALALLIYFVYARPGLRLSSGWRASLIAIRCALIVLIFICLMRPVIVVPSVVPQSTYVAVLMDDSSSMKLTDEQGGARLDALKRVMTPGSDFYQQLSDRFKVRAFKFAARAERVADAGELTASGDRTNLAAALDQGVRDAAGLPLSAVVVMTDGAINVEGDATSGIETTINNLRARGLPVFAVGVGQPLLEGDIELIRVTAPRRVLRGSTVTAEMLIQASGGTGSVKIDLTEDNHLLRSQEVPLQANATTVARVSFIPSSPGLHRYTFAAQPSPGEPVTENNSQEILIEVEDAHPKVLYVEGEPRWEYGKLRAAMSEEKNVVLTSVVRSADGKFYRQGVESGEELATGFPKSEEELFKYDAIILGSIEATFFTFDQLKAIEQFVSRRGGTLVMLGGSKSFNAGGYANTPVADLLPVYLSGNAQPSETQAFKAAPSDRGKDHPAARLAEQADANQKAWEQMPAVTLPDVIRDLKPGATVILEARDARDRSRTAPLLVEQRYGRGRTLALLASDTWRWRMMMESSNQSYETFWRNHLRYLVEAVRNRVEAAPERGFNGLGEAVRLRVEVADEKFLNVTDARVTAKVTSPTGRVMEVDMKPVVEGGFEGYAGVVVPDEQGLYKVEALARRGATQGSATQRGETQRGETQAAVVGSCETSFLVGPLDLEARSAAQNRELLRRIASDTGGQYYTMNRLSNLLEDITHAEGAGAVRETKDLWDMPINFMLLIGLAAGEWFIRKRKGLA